MASSTRQKCRARLDFLHWKLIGPLWFAFMVTLRTTQVNGKSQFRCEVNMCLYVYVLHAVCIVYILRAPGGLPPFPPAHKPQCSSFNP